MTDYNPQWYWINPKLVVQYLAPSEWMREAITAKPDDVGGFVVSVPAVQRRRLGVLTDEAFYPCAVASGREKLGE